MPGIFYHLACANLVRTKIGDLDSTNFFLGNIIPDLAKYKQASHYQYTSNTGWQIPNIYHAKSDIDNYLEKINGTSSYPAKKSLLLGVYCHLCLDYHFVRNYLGKKYVYEKGLVFNELDGKSTFWNPEDFLSKYGLYGAYSSSNLFLIRDHYIPVAEIFSLPENPPLTGLITQDERNSSNWKHDIEAYLANPVNYTGHIFTYEELKEMVETGAEAFLSQINAC